MSEKTSFCEHTKVSHKTTPIWIYLLYMTFLHDVRFMHKDITTFPDSFVLQVIYEAYFQVVK
jgi:hypothetical protein